MIRRAFFLAVPLGVALVTPASSQGFLEALFGLRPFAPVYAPPRYRANPYGARSYRAYRGEPRRIARRPVEKETVAVPLKPKPMGEVENPVPRLLTDSTLRAGDIVMFPDGPRVFKGKRGAQHQLSDFVALSVKSVPPATRKLLAVMPVGSNPAWSEEISAKNKVAGTDVETTGSVKQRARR